jgi:hypothetical protein
MLHRRKRYARRYRQFKRGNRPHFQQIRRQDKCSPKPCSPSVAKLEQAAAEVDDVCENSKVVAMKP